MTKNIIYGKTTDGRDFTLDGYRIESFTSLGNTSVGEIVEVVFKSGQTLRVISVDDNKGCSLWSDLVYASQLKNPLPTPSATLTDFTKIDGSYGFFDCNAVEFLISWKSNSKDKEGLVELHFASGKTFTVFADSLDTGGEYQLQLVDNVVVDYIIRHNREQEL
jgi:uncharacterized iron-regulated protein